MAEEKTSNATLNTYDTDDIPCGMLSSTHIAYCVNKYNIIDGFDKSCLGPATYHMRIGGMIRTWDHGKKIEFLLGNSDDINKNIRKRVDLRPNSLTFVTTTEKFRLPKDIIARFNLKSKWVHKGLLLGTGPIVDPQLHGNLLIPLHNFSSQVVTLEFNDELISVEFTKTLNPNHKFDDSDREFPFIENKSWDFDQDKYWDRIGRVRVESSVSSSFEGYEETIADNQKKIDNIARDSQKVIDKFQSISLLAALGLLIALIGLVCNTWSIIDKARDHLTEATNIMKSYHDKKFDLSGLALKSTTEELQKQIKDLKEQQNKINSELLLMSTAKAKGKSGKTPAKP